MANDYCPICKEWMLFPNSHKCKPLFYCGTEPDDVENRIFASDAAEAAEKYADAHDWDYCDWSHTEQTVYVQSSEDDPIRKFAVTMEMIPHYHAREEKEG